MLVGTGLVGIHRENNLDQNETPPTVTDTVTPPPPGEPGGTEPAPATPSNWTPDAQIGNPGEKPGQPFLVTDLLYEPHEIVR